MTFDEDRSQVHCGRTPQMMAAFRNTAIGLLRVAGEPNIAAAWAVGQAMTLEHAVAAALSDDRESALT